MCFLWSANQQIGVLTLALVDFIDHEGEIEDTEDTSTDDAGSTNDGGTTPAVVKPTLDEVLSDEEAKAEFDKRVQVEADRRFENARRKEAARTRKESAAQERERVAREEWDLAQRGDHEALGERRAEQLTKQETLVEAAKTVAGFIEEALYEHPDIVRVIGSEKISDVAKRTQASGGDIVDFTAALVAAATEGMLSAEDIDAKIAEAVEAKLKEAGVSTRSNKDDDGESPAEDLIKPSGAGGGSGRSIIDRAGDGEDVPFDQLLAELRKAGINPLKY